MFNPNRSVRAFAGLATILVAARILMLATLLGAVMAFVLKAVDHQLYDGDQWIIITVCIIILVCVVSGFVRPKRY